MAEDRTPTKRRRRRGGDPDQATRTVTRDEAFRVLRSNLQVAIDELANPVVLITSAQGGEGKTSLSVNLAESLAMAGSRVVLVDADFRNPDSHRLLGAHNEIGMSDVLLERASLEDALQYVELPARRRNVAPAGLYFLSTGEDVHNPAELLGSRRTGKLLEALSKQADIVLLDTPPVLPVADTLVIGRLAAGAVLVIEARRTPIPAVIRAKDALTRNQTRILGVALNRLQDRDAGETTGYGYGYGYGYGSGASVGDRPRPAERRRGAEENGVPSPELVRDGQAEE